MQKTQILPIFLVALGSLQALASYAVERSMNSSNKPGEEVVSPASASPSVVLKRTASGPTLTLLVPNAAGEAGGGFFPMERAFDSQPMWDAALQMPVGGGMSGADAPSFDNRFGFIDFGPNYADIRITGTWTLYMPWSSGDQTPYAALWWDDDMDNVNDNGIVETGLNFNNAVDLPNTGAGDLWVEDTNHDLSPITPPMRYLICQSPATMTNRAKEYAIVGYMENSPRAPSGLVTTAVGSSQVALSWTDNSNNETGFELERSATLGSGFVTVHTTAVDETAYTDAGLTAETTYYYRVRAVNASGASAYSAALSVTTTPTNPTLRILIPPGAGEAGGGFFPMEGAFDSQPSWDANVQMPTGGGTTNADAPSFGGRYGYIDFGSDYASVRITGTWTLYMPWSSGDQTPYAALWWDDDVDNVNDNGIVETGLNFNSAVGLPNTGAEDLWLEDTNHELSPITPPMRYLICQSPATMTNRAKEYAIVGYREGPPGAPSQLEVLHVDENSARLGWQDGSDNEVGFSIERSTSPTTGYAVVGTTDSDVTEYEDSGLPANTLYYYRVQAMNASGASGYSNTLEVSTTQMVAADATLTHRPRHNGSITAIKWRNFGDEDEKLYTYHYDEASQLEAAYYATGQTSMATGNWSTTEAGGFSVPGIAYDPNGNITTLNRQADEEGVRTIDVLSYTYTGSNQLVAVSDLTGWGGFADKHTGGNDYAYDANGNLATDENQGIDSIVYNHMDLPERINKTTGEYILYAYDAAGVKLSEELYNAQGERVKRTDYLGEFIFEDGELKQVYHEEGRIVPDATTGGFEYQYFLRDHLGNNRVVVSATPKAHTFTLNYEGLGDDDQPLFQEVTTTGNDIFDHTDANDTTYTHAQMLDGSEGNRVGSVIALPVHAGDTLTASVFAKYVEITPDPSTVVTSLASNLITAFTGSSGGMNEMGNGTITTNFGSGSLVGTTGFPLEDENAPMAFLNVMFLPSDEMITLEKDITFAYDQLAATATQRLDEPKNTNYDELRIDNFVAPGQGYILVYLSNESSTRTEVYFDDLSLELNQYNVTQKDDYYPFGLSFNEFRRPELDKNEYLYQGKEELEGTDWYDFHARNYHAGLGRFMSVDPVYNGPSGYVGMLNNPVSVIDPTGEDPTGGILTAVAIAAAIRGISYTASIALSDGGFNNWDWGQFGQQVAIGAASAPITFGIGTAFQNAYTQSLTFGQRALKAAVHAHVQGSISEVTGGDYLSSAAAGFVGGVVSGSIGSATQGWTSELGRSSVEIGSSMLLGGISAEIAQDGEFWRGAAVAGIVAGANDVAHRLGNNRLEKMKADQNGDPPCPDCPGQTVDNSSGNASGNLGLISVGLGLVEEGTDLIKSSQTIVVPVYNEAGKAIAGWKVISKQTGKILTYIKAGASFGGHATAGFGVAVDAVDLANGNISVGRFSYHTAGTIVATGTTIFGTGGLGALVSGVAILGEVAYDTWVNDVQPAMKNVMPTGGWYPPR